MNSPIFAVLSSGFSGVLTSTNRRPVRNLVHFPSLFLIFSFIKDDRSTHPGLTSAVSMSFPSHDIGMSQIHTFVSGTSSPPPPLKMNGFLSCTCTVCCQRVIPSTNNTFRAVLVKGYTRHSPRIPVPQVSSPPHSLFRLLGIVLTCRALNRHQRAKFRRNRKTGSTAILV